MPDPTPAPADLAAALGRIPSGLFILTVRDGDRSTGMLASWVQQAGFDPPMLTVAVRLDRFVGDWLRSSGRFVLNAVRAGDKSLLRHFGKGFDPDEPAFEGIPLADPDHPAGPILADAASFLVAEPVSEMATGDHAVILARIVAGAVLDDDATPLVHIRRNGLHY